MADEIEVEGEPWTGLVVVADRWMRPDVSGSFGLVQAAEWHLKSDDTRRPITLWRGPGKQDEKAQKLQFEEIQCGSVQVDERGFYTCLTPFPDILEEAVQELAEPMMDEMANERAAESSSYIHEGYEDDFDEHVWIKAEYGDAVAVNGELTQNPKNPPRGWVETDQGGRDPSGMEEEIELESFVAHLTYKIEEKVGHKYDEKDVLAVLSRQIRPRQGGYIMWTSGSGNVEVWTTKKGLKEYEERKEAHAKAAREKRDREIREAREKEKEERRRKMRQGGYPGPKDWSPTGE